MKQQPAASNVKSLLFRLAGIALVAGSFLFAWFMMDFRAFRTQPLAIPEAGMTLEIQPGYSLRTVAANLARDGIVQHPVYLVLLGRYLKLDNRIRAGEYRIEPGLTPEQLLRQLTAGKVIQHELTLIEGESFRDMMQRVRQSPSLVHELVDGQPSEIMSQLGLHGVHPEGRFLPETYHFPRGMTDREFLRRAYRAMETFLARAWPERDPGLPLQSPYEALILASVVEKETGLAEERPRIAGVFVRRLKLGMRLQSDPTIIYGLGESFDGDIRYRDLRTDTPYNSYTRDGLPPTPIAMPGKDAILAVLHPEDTGDLFFVARGDGSHYFSRTLEEHNRAVRRYQLKKK